MKPIRPKVLFRAIEAKFPNQNVGFKVNIPSSDIGGMTLLESSVLVCLVKLSDAKSLFEFGTFMGATTLLLAENTSPDSHVTTLDISPEEFAALEEKPVGDVLKDGDANDKFLRNQFALQGARCIVRAGSDIQDKVRQILQNSTTMDVPALGFDQQFDFIFIDGGHHYEIVKKDTENAYLMAKPNAVIVWHDYASTIHSDVTAFLDQHANGRQIFHVENTMIAFELLGDFSTLIAP